ncbi:MAG: acyl-[acyl-carrier-protein]--UDP-N-acetylglucosamine O-acyltransferase, partial [Proteobacteria bacterium]|nr:acyl-[acyl-carrier-protein]--UDP-N-acetylglucosamine O-acyltransferase [Pseudomonadota bacterium]
INYAALAGHVMVEDGVTVGGYCGIHQFVRLGAHCFIGLQSRVVKDVPPYLIGQGADDFTLHGPNSIGLRRKGFNIVTIRAIKEAFRLIFRNNRPLPEVLEEVLAEYPDVPEVIRMVEFIQGSKRGVYR